MASDTSKREQSFDLKSGTTDAAAVSGYYDDWASTYDDTLKSWNYQARLTPPDGSPLTSRPEMPYSM